MTWAIVLSLGAVAYGFKALGLVVIGSRQLPAPLERCLDLVPAALLAALVVKETFSTGQQLAIDARFGGLAAAVVAARLRATFVVVVVAAAVVTALLRQL